VSEVTLEGGCDCRAVRYRMESAPMVVHCCHCRWCQRESGASFALNAMIESSRLTSLGIAPDMVLTPSESGAGQRIARCPECKVALWSHYASAGPVVAIAAVTVVRGRARRGVPRAPGRHAHVRLTTHRT
jgi:hypothetical protein